MKTISSTAIAALMTATLGLSAVAPAMAQSAAAAPTAEASQSQTTAPHAGDRAFRPGQNDPRHNGNADLLNFERGGEAIEVALVRLAHRLDLTDAQKSLLETLKADALAAADSLKTTTDTLRPAAPTESETTTAPNLADRLETRIAIDTARLDALKSVQPALTAFFDSLTDEQKADLMPQRGPNGDQAPHAGKQGNGPDRRDDQRSNGQRPGGPGQPNGPASTNNG